jgi:hypothetical protein
MDQWIRQTEAWETGPSFTVYYPVCGGDFISMAAVEVNQGGNVVEVQPWPNIDVRLGPIPGRGTAASLRMWLR